MAIHQGANTDELRALGRQFAVKSVSIQNVQGSIDQLTARLPQVWAGQDADEFTRQWLQTHRPTIQKLATALNENAKTLVANADAQERVSASLDGPGAGPGGGPVGGPGAGPGGTTPGKDAPWIPDWLENSPFFKGWDMYSLAKAFPNIRFGLSDLYLAYKGLDVTNDADKLAVQFRNAFKITSDIFDGSFADLAKMGGLSETSNVMKGLEIGGKGLAGLGIGIDGFQAIDHFADGDIGQGAYSTVKAALGAGAIFAPPPADVACVVASGALALYDNVPVIHDTVNAIGSGVKDVAEDAWNGAKDFFGF